MNLRELYEVDRLSTARIAQLLGLSKSATRDRLIAAGATFRTHSESLIGRKFAPSERRDVAQRANSLLGGAATKKSPVLKVCEHCGSSFGIRPSMARSNPGRFCSNSCRYAAMRGEAAANWRHGNSEKRPERRVGRWRRLVFERDGKQCQRCGGDQNPEAHHIVGWNCVELRFDPANGVTLCRSCHRWVHSPDNPGWFLAHAVPA
jgi:hypothetical protein